MRGLGAASRWVGVPAVAALIACGGDGGGFGATPSAPTNPDAGPAASASSPAACVPAAATPVALAQSLPVWNLGVTVADGAVFFRTFSPHTVWRIAEGGGAPSRVWTGSVGIFGAGIATTGGFAYWSGLDSERGGLQAVFRAPIGGGPALVVGYLPSRCAAYGGVAVDDTSVYAATIACSLGKATLAKLPLGGGGAQTLWTDDVWTIGGIALADRGVVISAATGDGDADEDDHGTYGEVLVVPEHGGTAHVLAHLTTAGPIASDGDAAYWIDGDVLAAATFAGGPVTTLATGMRDASSIAVDARGVYVGIGGTRTKRLHQGTVVFVPKRGGAATVLADNVDQLGDIAVDAGVVYWSTLGNPDGPQHGGVYRLDPCGEK